LPAALAADRQLPLTTFSQGDAAPGATFPGNSRARHPSAGAQSCRVALESVSARADRHDGPAGLGRGAVAAMNRGVRPGWRGGRLATRGPAGVNLLGAKARPPERAASGARTARVSCVFL